VINNVARSGVFSVERGSWVSINSLPKSKESLLYIQRNINIICIFSKFQHEKYEEIGVYKCSDCYVGIYNIYIIFIYIFSYNRDNYNEGFCISLLQSIDNQVYQ